MVVNGNIFEGKIFHFYSHHSTQQSLSSAWQPLPHIVLLSPGLINLWSIPFEYILCLAYKGMSTISTEEPSHLRVGYVQK